MCDFSGKLIAWMDRELTECEAEAVERHVRACAECRRRIHEFEEVSRAFAGYCDAAVKVPPRAGLPYWVPTVSSAAAVAALLLVFLRPLVQPVPLPPRVAQAAPTIAVQTAPGVAPPVRPRHMITQVKTPVMSWEQAEPAIRIAIPAEAIFPPGAVPEGVNFVAELSIAADGSAQALRLQP